MYVYKIISICLEGKIQQYNNHRFIYEIFKGYLPSGFIMNYINNNKQNNRLYNLKMTIKSEKSKKDFKERSCKLQAERSIQFNSGDTSDFAPNYLVSKVMDVNPGSV